MYPNVGSLGSAVKNMFCERRWICICTGLSDVSKCWFSRKLFQKFCTEYVLRDN